MGNDDVTQSFVIWLVMSLTRICVVATAHLHTPTSPYKRTSDNIV